MIIGILAGGFGVGAAVFAVLFTMGSIEYLGGRKKNSIPSVPVAELKTRLSRLNSPELPYQIKATGEKSFVFEWKIADANWFAVLSKERLKEIYRGYLLLDEDRKSVRYCEEIVSVRWLASANGAPSFVYRKNFFRGRILFQKTWEVQYGIKEDLSLGKVYEIKFDVNKVRGPIKKVIEESGWEFVPVVSKSHATEAH